jgi:hypothetical protein
MKLSLLVRFKMTAYGEGVIRVKLDVSQTLTVK